MFLPLNKFDSGLDFGSETDFFQTMMPLPLSYQNARLVESCEGRCDLDVWFVFEKKKKID